MTIRQLTCFGMLLAANLLAMGERSLLADERDEFFEARIRPVLLKQCSGREYDEGRMKKEASRFPRISSFLIPTSHFPRLRRIAHA